MQGNSLDTTVYAVETAVKRAVDKSSKNIVFRPATVLDTSSDGTLAEVALDADLEGTPVGVQIIYPTGIFPGDRVLIMFDSPHGAYLIGRRGGDFDRWHIVGNPDETEAPQFNTGWGNHSTTSWPNTPNPGWVSYRRHGRVVELRGLAERTSGSSTAIFRLPQGYCPENELLIAGVGALTGYLAVQIEQIGWVRAPAGGSVVSLDGISFSINRIEDGA